MMERTIENFYRCNTAYKISYPSHRPSRPADQVVPMAGIRGEMSDVVKLFLV